MNKNHFELASQLVAEIEVFGDLRLARFGIRSEWLIGMQHYGIPFVPTYWAGSRGARKKMRLVRATTQLVESGHLKRLTKARPDRTSHVVPTAEFLMQTVQALGAEVDRPSLYGGLNKTDWGRGMIADIQTQLGDEPIDVAKTKVRNR